MTRNRKLLLTDIISPINYYYFSVLEMEPTAKDAIDPLFIYGHFY